MSSFWGIEFFDKEYNLTGFNRQINTSQMALPQDNSICKPLIFLQTGFNMRNSH